MSVPLSKSNPSAVQMVSPVVHSRSDPCQGSLSVWQLIGGRPVPHHRHRCPPITTVPEIGRKDVCQRGSVDLPGNQKPLPARRTPSRYTPVSRPHPRLAGRNTVKSQARALLASMARRMRPVRRGRLSLRPTISKSASSERVERSGPTSNRISHRGPTSSTRNRPFQMKDSTFQSAAL